MKWNALLGKRSERRRRGRSHGLEARATIEAFAAMELLEARRLLSGTWTLLTRAAPGSLGTMMLLPDGTVMAQINGTSADWARLTPDSTGSYSNGIWTRLASMQYTRLYDASQVLQD